MPASIAQMLLVDLLGEEIDEEIDEAGSVDALVGEIYDPVEDWR